MAFATPYMDKLYYGQYGGCFISDAFTISCDELYKAYTDIALAPEFTREVKRLADKFAPSSLQTETHEINGKTLRVCHVPFNACAIAGHALLGARMGKKTALFAPRFADEAIFCAQVCGELGLAPKLHLPLALRGIDSLTDWLAALGAELETKLCETFDMPEMYAFQEWVAAPGNTCCIYSRSNVGAFPATLMTTAFSRIFYTGAEGVLGTPDAIVAPCISGTTALTMMKPFFGQGVHLYTAELEDTSMTEELDSFCGAFTKVMRNRTQDRVLAPELANAWDEGVVERTFVGRGDAVAMAKAVQAQSGMMLSLNSAAALHRAAGLRGDVLVACAPPRMGALL